MHRLMNRIESNLKAGKQSSDNGRAALEYGVSITDGQSPYMEERRLTISLHRLGDDSRRSRCPLCLCSRQAQDQRLSLIIFVISIVFSSFKCNASFFQLFTIYNSISQLFASTTFTPPCAETLTPALLVALYTRVDSANRSFA